MTASNQNQMEYFLQSRDPWLVYRTLMDLQGLDKNNPQVLEAKSQILKHPLIMDILTCLEQWPGVVLNSHKSAGQLYHKLEFLADIGLDKKDLLHTGISEKLVSNVSEEGLLQLPVNIPVHFGGNGRDTYGWALCDAPVLLYAALATGIYDALQARKGVEFLISLVRANGWPCVVSKELGKFRGPGRNDDSCPYVNLIMLKLLAQLEDYKDSEAAHAGVESLLHQWENSREAHPYMFYMGTDFRKLKAPFIWFDILHAADILSRYDFALKDNRFLDMLDVIHSKADENGHYTAESEWKAWKEWEFGQKKIPSPWITFLVERMDQRVVQYSSRQGG